MKVTFVLADVGMAGGVRVIATYAHRLLQRGHEVTVVATPPRQLTGLQKVKSLLRGTGWPRVPRTQPSPFDDLPVPLHITERRLVTDADVPDADVVVATWWETAPWVARLSGCKGAKAYFMQDYGASGQPLEHVAATWSLPLHLITISRWLAELVRSRCSAPVSLVPNSVDHDVFTAPPRGKQRRPTVGFVYTTLPEKGCDVTTRACEIARERLGDLHVVSFGTIPPTDSMPLPEGAEFSCRVPAVQLAGIYSRCDAWLFGSRREGFGLPILEAMACRTPVIATPAGAAPELLATGGGVLLGAPDAAEMARAIEEVCSLPDRRWRGMSDAAYAVATRYTWDDAADLFEAALHRAIERTRRGELAAVGARTEGR